MSDCPEVKQVSPVTALATRIKYRKLRIAWSVACSVLCLLLIALWVRSNRQVDTLDDFSGYRIDVKQGELVLSERVQRTIGQSSPNFSISAAVARSLIKLPSTSVVVASIPLWVLVVVGSLLAATPWIGHFKWRFSLRTLLIGMTLVAIALGLVFALAR
jgi:hypothetical protein